LLTFDKKDTSSFPTRSVNASTHGESDSLRIFPEENGFAIRAEVQRRFATLQDGRAMVFPPPPV